MMIKYKSFCSNFPPDDDDLNQFAESNWEFVGVCTIAPDDDVAHHLSNLPANHEQAKQVRYVWYFKRSE